MAVANFIQTVPGRKATAYEDLFPMGASEVVSAYGGRFVTNDGSGRFEISTAASTRIDGWVDTCYTPNHNGTSTSSNTTPITCSSTEGATVLIGTGNIYDIDNAFWVPLASGETATANDIGLRCDLVVSSDVQYVKPSVTTHKHVIVAAVDTINSQYLVYANIGAS